MDNDIMCNNVIFMDRIENNVSFHTYRIGEILC